MFVSISVEKENSPMKCAECGSELGADEKFCGSCGAPVEAEAPSAEAPVLSSGDETVISDALELPPIEPDEPSVPEEPEFAPPPPPPPPPPIQPAQGGDKKKTWMIVAIVAVVLILCCCCVVVGGASLPWDNILRELESLGMSMLSATRNAGLV
jgi:zinc-ribbon domain